MAVIVKDDLSKIPSISGNNGYSLRCEEVKINGESAYCSYSVCQHTILAFKGGTAEFGKNRTLS
ncbi:TPA: hypothetical protein HMM51_24135 [Escherichia coli]|nr:hypothetical protein [Escherichia coli]